MPGHLRPGFLSAIVVSILPRPLYGARYFLRGIPRHSVFPGSFHGADSLFFPWFSSVAFLLYLPFAFREPAVGTRTVHANLRDRRTLPIFCVSLAIPSAAIQYPEPFLWKLRINSKLSNDSAKWFWRIAHCMISCAPPSMSRRSSNSPSGWPPNGGAN